MNEQSTLPSIEPSRVQKNIWPVFILVSIVITALIIGGVAYAYYNNKLKSIENYFLQQITLLQNQIKQLDQQIKTVQNDLNTVKNQNNNITTTNTICEIKNIYRGGIPNCTCPEGYKLTTDIEIGSCPVPAGPIGCPYQTFECIKK